MPSLNLDIEYFDHPKTKRLVGLLGRGSEVLPIRLWAHCAKVHPETGRLTGYAAQEIESIVNWWGTKGKMVEKMVVVGFLDRDSDGTYVVHEWLDYQGHIRAFHIRAKAGARARWKKMEGESLPASSMQQECLKQSPNLPTNQRHNVAGACACEADGGDDPLDSEIRKYLGGHPRLMWDAETHRRCRKLVEGAGWTKAKELIEQGIAAGKSLPVGWALTKWGNHENEPSNGGLAVSPARAREIAAATHAKVVKR